MGVMGLKKSYLMESAVEEFERGGRVHKFIGGLSGFSVLGVLVMGVLVAFLGFSEEALGFAVGFPFRVVLGVLLMGYVLLVVSVVSIVVWGIMSFFGGRSYGISYVRVLRAGIVIGSLSLASVYVFWFGVLNLDNWSYLYMVMVTMLLMSAMWSSLVYERGMSYVTELRKSGYVLTDDEFNERFGSGEVVGSDGLVDEQDDRSEAEIRGYDVDEHGFILPTERNRNLKLSNRDRREGIDVNNLANQVADYRNGSGDVIEDTSSPEGSNESTESIESENSERVEKSDEQK